MPLKTQEINANNNDSLTIQKAIDRGWINCPEGGELLSVAADGQVQKCPHFEYWNLFVQTGGE